MIERSCRLLVLHCETMMNNSVFLNFSTPFRHNSHTVAATIRSHHADLLCDVWSIIKHPRSLARPNANWQAPVKQLPAIDTLKFLPWAKDLQLSVTRLRVGPKIRHQLHVFNEATKRQAAYIITVQFHSPLARGIPQYFTEGWIHAVVGEKYLDCVHHLTGHVTSTYIWVVDSQFQPIHSPASLFYTEPKSA